MSTTTETAHYEAETCHTGGHLCGHKHRTREAAARCLPKLPKQSSGSLTRYFSMAGVVAVNDAAKALDRRREANRACVGCGFHRDDCSC